MRSRLMMRAVGLVVAATLLSTGCMFTRAVDRAFIGVTVRRATFPDRKTTGIFLVPITMALDIATLPIQALLVVILGDNFPFHDAKDALQQTVAQLEENPQFQKLDKQRQDTARAGLAALLRAGNIDASSVLALTEEGLWVFLPVDAEARVQLIARAQAPSPPLMCRLESP